MRRPAFAVLLLAAAILVHVDGFQLRQPSLPLRAAARASSSRQQRSKGAALALFDFFGGANKKTKAEAAPTAASAPVMTPAAARRAVKIPDNGPKFPRLYDDYFNDKICSDMSNAIKAALKDGLTRMEVVIPPIPNVEELEFGTALNQQYNKALAARLKAPENISRKSLLAYANVDWANRLAQKIGKRTFLAAFDGTVKRDLVKLNAKAELVGINSAEVAGAGAGDVVIALSPGTQSMWSTAGGLKTAAPVIGLNAPFSLSYDIGYNPSKFEQIYVMKRCTKGWIYRSYPGPYKAYLENPDGSVTLVKVYEKGEVPKLRDVSALIREESQARGYAILNDRYLTPRL